MGSLYYLWSRKDLAVIREMERVEILHNNVSKICDALISESSKKEF